MHSAPDARCPPESVYPGITSDTISSQDHLLRLARMAQGLLRNPVLAVSAVQVASEHPETEGERAGHRMEERLLLHRVALDGPGVAPRNVERPLAIEAHFADAGESFTDGTAVST